MSTHFCYDQVQQRRDDLDSETGKVSDKFVDGEIGISIFLNVRSNDSRDVHICVHVT